MRLGKLLQIKTGQTVFQQMADEGVRGQQALAPRPGYTQNTGPVTTGAQLGIEGAGIFGGEIGEALAAFAPLFAPQIKEYLGIDISAPIKYGYGGNPEAARLSQQITAQLTQQQFQDDGEMVKRMGGFMASQFDHLPSWAKGAAQSLGITKDNVGEWVSSWNPAMVGQVYGVAAANVPGIAAFMGQLDPSKVSPAAFVEQTLLQNKGQWDPKLYEQNRANFLKDFQSGAYGSSLGAPQAAQAMQYAQRQFGDEAAKNPRYAHNLARIADSANTSLGISFDQALNLMGSRGAAQNPKSALNELNQLHTIAKRWNLSGEEIAQGAAAAKEKGLDPIMGAHLVAQAGRFRQQYGEAGGSTFSGDAATAYTQLGNSPALEALGAASSLGVGRYAEQIEAAKRRGDPRRLIQLGERALRDPQLQQVTGGDYMGKGHGQRLMSTVGFRMGQGVMMGEAQKAIQSAPAHLRKKLQRALTTKADDTMKMFQSGDFSSLRNPELAQSLQNNRALASTVYATDPTTRVKGKVAPRRRIRQPVLPSPSKGTAAPLSNFSLPHPAASQSKT